MEKIIKAYRDYQARFGINHEFDPGQQSLGKESFQSCLWSERISLKILNLIWYLSSAASVKETHMQFIQIHISPTTFDQLELDVRVTIGQN